MPLFFLLYWFKARPFIALWIGTQWEHRDKQLNLVFIISERKQRRNKSNTVGRFTKKMVLFFRIFLFTSTLSLFFAMFYYLLGWQKLSRMWMGWLPISFSSHWEFKIMAEMLVLALSDYFKGHKLLCRDHIWSNEANSEDFRSKVRF